MRKFVCLVAVLSLSASAVLGGCAGTADTLSKNRGTAIGAGAGAVGGAAIGAALGGKRGAIAGGLLGALAGGVIGRYSDEKEKGLPETQTAYGYTSDQGTRLKIESVRANPAVLGPGETVGIHLTYAVLTATDNELVPVRETRRILRDGAHVGETSIDVERQGGTWRSTVPVTIPDDAAAGNYTVTASVEIRGGASDAAEAYFKVQR